MFPDKLSELNLKNDESRFQNLDDKGLKVLDNILGASK